MPRRGAHLRGRGGVALSAPPAAAAQGTAAARPRPNPRARRGTRSARLRLPWGWRLEAGGEGAEGKVRARRYPPALALR